MQLKTNRLPAALAFFVFRLTGKSRVSLGFSKNEAIRYESRSKAGKFLVTLKGDSEQIEKAKKLVGDNNAESVDVVDAIRV